MTNESFVFDTYAIIEITNGNPNYLPYSNAKIVLTKLNAFELFYNILKQFGKEKALDYLEKYFKNVIDFDDKVIIQAAEFRLVRKTKNLSMTDCIGYILSKSLGIKFLTGNEKFKDMENVEFVK